MTDRMVIPGKERPVLCGVHILHPKRYARGRVEKAEREVNSRPRCFNWRKLLRVVHVPT